MTLPVIGAALGTAGLETWRDWILEKNRDLELQAFHTAAVLDDDWSAEVAQDRDEELGLQHALPRAAAPHQSVPRVTPAAAVTPRDARRGA